MTMTARKGSLVLGGGVLIALLTAYFGTQCVAGFERLGGQRAYFSGDFTSSWTHYRTALSLGGDRETLEISMVETLLFGLDQQALGVKVALPMPVEDAVTAARTLLARRLSAAPYKANYWSLVSDLNLYEARRERQRTPLDLSTLSENPVDNLLPHEGIAIAALSEAARREPGNYIYEDLLAEQYLEWGIVDRAVEHVRKSLALYPALGGHAYLSQPPVEKAIVNAALAGLDAAAAAESMIPNELIECDAGSLLLAQGRSAEAVSYFKRALERSPGMPDALYRYGEAAYIIGDYPKADEMLSRAAPKFPDVSSPYYYLGLTRLKEGKGSEAIEALRTAREIDPHGIELFSALAGALESQGKLKDAERQLMAAAHLNPTRPEAWASLLDFYARHAELSSEARRTCTHLDSLKLNPQYYKQKCDNLLKAGS
jgi:tetratricopeptide (TPR) repeat protein